MQWYQVLFCYPVVWLFSEGFASFSVSFEVNTGNVCWLPCLSCRYASKIGIENRDSTRVVLYMQ